MRTLFIRHGQSENNKKDTDDLAIHSTRAADPPLSSLGRRQVQQTAERLRKQLLGGRAVKAVFCSPMQRAIETAAILRDRCELGECVFEAHADLCEEGGLFEGQRFRRKSSTAADHLSGLTREEIAARWPWLGLADSLTPEGWWNKGIERKFEAQERASRVARRLWQMSVEDPTGIYIFITHGLFQDRLIKTIQWYPDVPKTAAPGGGERYYSTTFNCGMTVLDFQMYDESTDAGRAEFIFDYRSKPPTPRNRCLGVVFQNWPLVDADLLTGQRIGPQDQRIDSDAW